VTPIASSVPRVGAEFVYLASWRAV
jgi:hypothetical protein